MELWKRSATGNNWLNKVTGILKKRLGILMFLVSLVVGLFAYGGYGIAWDEPFSHLCGETTYNYVVNHDNSLRTFKDRAYGIAFELPLVVVEKALSLSDTRSIYLMRHLVTHVFFLFSAFVLFILINYMYHNKLLAAAGFLMLVLNPVLYAHSFFNSKDIPFMSMFIICFLLSAIAFKKNRLKYFVLLGIGCGLLTNIRIMGIMLIGLITLLIVIEILRPGNVKAERINKGKELLAFLVASALTLFITWPYLWISPFGNLIDAFRAMANFYWDGEVLYLGKPVNAHALPWHYGIVWFLVSNPLLYICFGIFGIILLMIAFFRKPLRFISDRINWNYLIYLICFAGPILAVIVLRSTLYDSWRQLFFIYPGFLLLGIYGLNYLLKTRLRKTVLFLAFAGFMTIAYFMVTNHPFQHVFFNRLLPRDKPDAARKTFDMDYWGTSYKYALEYILARDTSSKIVINVANFPKYQAGFILKPEERERIVYDFGVELESAEYFVTDYRWHPTEYEDLVPYRYHSVKVFNSTILTIFKKAP
jgi:hypothetical protein